MVVLEKYDDVLTVKDVCDILHYGKNSVYHMLKTQEIPNRQVKRKYIIPKQGLINYLNNIAE